MPDLNPDVLCIGHAAYDLTFAVPRHPQPDEKSFASAFVGCGGGPAANAAVMVARLGRSAAFAGYISQDTWGELQWTELRQEGVSTDWIVRGTAPTPLSVVLVKPDGTRSLVNYKGGTAPLSASRLDLRPLVPKVILFDGHEPELSLALLKTARDRRIPTLLDAGSVHSGTQALADQVDYLVCSETFARQWTGENDEDRALLQLEHLAPSIVITLGGRGLVWKRPGGAGRLPAVNVKAVDTTGAGDAFHGALAVGLAAGWDWEACLRYASAAAALCCTKLGGRRGLPHLPEVMAFLDLQPTHP
jgi:sulfofructose kinase